MLQDFTIIIDNFLVYYLQNKEQILTGRAVNYSFLYAPSEIDGHFSSNFAMIVKGCIKEKITPEDVFSDFFDFLKKNNILANFENVFFTKPGFINFKIKKKDILQFFLKISKEGDRSLVPNIGNGQKINIEYVSCNPTGPMHIGHTRGAIVGDALCGLFSKVKYAVHREFCINDNGNQFDKLVQSVLFRYKAFSDSKLKSEDIFDKMLSLELYPAQYVAEIAKKIKPHDFDDKNEADKEKFIKNLALKSIMSEIKKTLKKMKIHHDEFVSVQNLIDNCDLKSILNTLSEQDLIYYGDIDEKIEDKQTDKEATNQSTQNGDNDKFLLFKTTQFDDDKDRVLLRKDGSLTYFAGDLIYHKDKIDRGFNKMILLLGEDHKGYEKRMKAIVKSLKEEAEIDIVLTNLVKFQKNGEEIKMSKRSGSFVTTEDVLSEIPIDVLRFIILSYKRNTNIAFDLEKSITQTAENPVFYVQYGYSRICSLLRKIEEQFAHFKSIKSFDEIDRMPLERSDFHNLDKIFSKIIFYPDALRQSVKQFDPSVLIGYVIDLSTLFHSAWNFGAENNLKFITDNEKENFKNYVILKSIQSIIYSILEIFQIEAMEKM